MDQPSTKDAELLLSKIMPPESVLVLGAVMPQRLRHISELGASSIVLVHPDDAFVQQVSEAPQSKDLNLQASSDIISATGGDVMVFKNSIDRESGLTPASALQPLWKNLEQTSEAKAASITLPDFVATIETPPNWLILDRLDGLSLVKEATHDLSNLDVVYVRCWNDEAASNLTTSEEAISVFGSNGLKLIARESERHPALETLLFARDYSSARTNLAAAELDLEIYRIDLEAYRNGKESEAEKRRKITQNNLTALEQRYSDLLAKNKKTEKLVADILARLARAETALDSDE